MGRVDGKVALISGAARGMGASHARLLAAEGARVVLGDVLDDEGRAVAEEIGDAARYVHLDVTNPEDWAAAVDLALNAFGALNVLVNNAGIVYRRRLRNLERERWQRVLDVNLTGTMLGMRAVIEPMTAAGGGSIINMSSIQAMRGTPGNARVACANGDHAARQRPVAAVAAARAEEIADHARRAPHRPDDGADEGERVERGRGIDHDWSEPNDKEATRVDDPGVHQRRDRSRGFHRVGQPAVEGKLCRFQQGRRHEQPCERGEAG